MSVGGRGLKHLQEMAQDDLVKSIKQWYEVEFMLQMRTIISWDCNSLFCRRKN